MKRDRKKTSIVRSQTHVNKAMMIEAARQFGRMGGNARKKSMTAEERSESARKAARARWDRIKTNNAY